MCVIVLKNELTDSHLKSIVKIITKDINLEIEDVGF